ncbi:membrane-spanning 4-domains subfamily A member 13 isoform X6 [Sarcophilus harrisii]|nr:membrane-spanning 4-domains subfamily A member 13 isoform X6 [Sarcophilus harrisii]
MMGSFHVLMWYFLFNLYNKQENRYFGLYSPITFKVHYPSWAFCFFMSGILSVNEAKNTSVQSRKLAFFGNVVSALVALLGIILIITELCMKSEMSYKNMSIAFVGKIVSGFLLLTSLLEFSLTFTYIYYIVCNWDSLMQKHMIHTDMGPDVQGTPCVEVEKEKKREEDGEWSMEKKVEEEKEQLEDNGKSKLKLEAAF